MEIIFLGNQYKESGETLVVHPTKCCCVSELASLGFPDATTLQPPIEVPARLSLPKLEDT